ncbi:MAG: Lon protease [Alphaproteobacteria bacterium MarineAlpha6_Bin6]|nr:MAG: Lon protease [Alphaproteobacteria bacterium MarineAlpha6_Bin6]PPR32537.1 MAG: Lon protease [Alphaproteobacteria bacterium MarineAlpha6_Bin5]
MSKLKKNQIVIPLLPLRDIVVFPGMITPLFVGRSKSISALEEVMTKDKTIFLVTQKHAETDDPMPDDIYNVGCIGKVIQLLKLPDGTIKALIEAQDKAQIVKYTKDNDYYTVHAELISKPKLKKTSRVDALVRRLLTRFGSYAKLNRTVPSEALSSLSQINDTSQFANTLASYIVLKIDMKQKLLELPTIQKLLDKILVYIENEIGVLEVEKKIKSRVRRQMEKTQREYYLNEQLKAVQKELGDLDHGKNEFTEIEEKIKNLSLTNEAKEKAESELKKLTSMSSMSAEASVVRNYLDWLLNVPWDNKSKINTDIKKAERILNDDHYGLEKVKERILEFLAVQKRVEKIQGPILCLVGPPGVGKTSLGKSIARATGREFARISLGGIRDESEIRGHRRTYIGSMPGKIIQGMKKVKKSNPLFLLDEIDKMGYDFRGDPSSALLEALDTEQNNKFNDHYLEVDYDLSNVMFITTANTLNIPPPLLDRMEVIRLPGYVEAEKVEIAKKHLIPKNISNHGLKKSEWKINDGALHELIKFYTKEAGVRNLEREITNIIRKAIRELSTSKKKTISINPKNIEKYAGVKKFRKNELEEKDLIGITTGLAWTEVGGELLLIEAVSVNGKGRIISTGKLGTVMKESVRAAESYVKSRSDDFGINSNFFNSKDIHVHVPEGATPKDGPSAGVAMCTSIVSVMTGIPVKRNVAMTGEITLRGRVLPIGGLKEKLIAANRSNIKTVLIPKDNKNDLSEIPKKLIKGLKIITVSNVDEVLKYSLTKKISPIDWSKMPVSEKKSQDNQFIV